MEPLHLLNDWQDQHARIKRWLRRLETTSTEDSTHYLDTAYACFQNIHYLKDWLKKSNKVKNKDMNDFIESHIELRVCRDICNRNKHFRVSNPSIDGHFDIAQKDSQYIVIASGHEFELLGLAEKCISLWESFLLNKKITT